MGDPKQLSIIWSDCFKYRADLRGFELTKIENILRYSEERYFDIITQRKVAVGKHDKLLGLVYLTRSRKLPLPRHCSCNDTATNQLPAKNQEVYS